MTIREIDLERDVDACVALLRETSPGTVTNRAAWLARTRAFPRRAQLAGFVAEEDARVVGESYGFLGLFGDVATGICMVTVEAEYRRRGIGRALFEPIEAHLAAAGVTSLLARFVENAPGVAFACALGFHEVRAETEAALDVRTVTEQPPADADLRPVSQTDPRHAHLVDVEATRDMPSTEEVLDMPYEEWARFVLDYPIFQPDGSFVAYVDGEPAAVSLLVADFETGRALNWFTGTRRAYRGRGLAAAVKLASIAWAREHGVAEMVTDNDETNAPMLSINRRLGFRPARRRVEYLREETAFAPAPPAPAT
ncbi:MAG TPA: GNAT family N-acetyltransferase [Gaiellaceae bacterium]